MALFSLSGQARECCCRHTLQRGLGIAKALFAFLLERGYVLLDACDGKLVRPGVEVVYCVVNELRRTIKQLAFLCMSHTDRDWIAQGAYRCGVFVKQHGDRRLKAMQVAAMMYLNR
jgi:predicted hydrolase (HD superfamily)